MSSNTNEYVPDSSQVNDVQTYVIAALAAIAWYNSIELVVLCLVTFKQYRGCYFWSLLIASFSIMPHCLGFIFFIYAVGISPYVSVTLLVLSWYPMVTGQSLVLWSRLHFVLNAPRVLHLLLILIILDAVLFHVPTTVLLYGTLGTSNSHFVAGYDAMERVQLIGFSVQEFLISSIYIWQTVALLRLRPCHRNRRILIELLLINVIMLALDVMLITIQFSNLYAVQVMFKPVVYSIKLKLEYAILGKLVSIATEASSDQYTASFETQGTHAYPQRELACGPRRVQTMDAEMAVHSTVLSEEDITSFGYSNYGRNMNQRAFSC